MHTRVHRDMHAEVKLERQPEGDGHTKWLWKNIIGNLSSNDLVFLLDKIPPLFGLPVFGILGKSESVIIGVNVGHTDVLY